MTAHTPGSITAYETEKWAREVLAITSDAISIGTIKSQVKLQMHKRFLQIDAKAVTATLDRLTREQVIIRTGQGTSKKYTYNQAHQPPAAFDDLATDLQQSTTYQIEDAFLERVNKERAFTPSMYRGHDWIGQGASYKPIGKAYYVHPGAVRPGCLDALECPSLQNGVRVARASTYIGQGIAAQNRVKI